ACVHDSYAGPMLDALLEEAHLRDCVQCQIALGVAHAPGVADLAGNVENHVALPDCVSCAVGFAQVDVQHFHIKACKIERVRAASGNRRVEHGRSCPQCGQAVSNVAAYKSQTAGEKNSLPLVETVPDRYHAGRNL